MNIDVPLNFLHVQVHGHLLLLSLGSSVLVDSIDASTFMGGSKRGGGARIIINNNKEWKKNILIIRR